MFSVVLLWAKFYFEYIEDTSLPSGVNTLYIWSFFLPAFLSVRKMTNTFKLFIQQWRQTSTWNMYGFISDYTRMPLKQMSLATNSLLNIVYYEIKTYSMEQVHLQERMPHSSSGNKWIKNHIVPCPYLLFLSFSNYFVIDYWTKRWNHITVHWCSDYNKKCCITLFFAHI